MGGQTALSHFLIGGLLMLMTIAMVDFVFLRLPILAGGIWGIRDRRASASCESAAASPS